IKLPLKFAAARNGAQQFGVKIASPVYTAPSLEWSTASSVVCKIFPFESAYWPEIVPSTVANKNGLGKPLPGATNVPVGLATTAEGPGFDSSCGGPATRTARATRSPEAS